MTTPIRAVAYYRKSTDDRKKKGDQDDQGRDENGRKKRDRDEVGKSIEQQQEWAREVVGPENAVLAAEFRDQSLSGLKTDRPDFLRMIAYCEEQHRLGDPIRAVVVWHPDRFSRADVVDTFEAISQLRKAGVALMLTSSHGWRDLHNPEHLLVYSVEQQASNNGYSRNLSAATRRGKRRAAGKGLWCGGRAPFGYRVENQKLVVDPASAESVQFMFAAYAGGTVGLRGLSALLWERGVKTPKGGAARWSPQSIRQVLRNPAYRGWLVVGRRDQSQFLGTVRVPAAGRGKVRKTDPGTWTTHQAAHDPVVEPELFDRVQGRLADNRERTSPAKARPYLLSGLLACGHCGGPMTGRTSTRSTPGGGRARARKYACDRFNSLGRQSGCHHNMVDAERLEAAVARKVSVLFTGDALAEVRDEIRRQESAPDAEAREKALEARLTDLDRQVAQATRRFAVAPDGLAEELGRVAQELAAERDQVRADWDVLRAASVESEDLDERVEKIAARFAQFQKAVRSGDQAVAQTLFRELIGRIEVHFTHEPSRGKSGRTLSSFTYGLIYARTDQLLGVPVLSSSRARGSPGPPPAGRPAGPVPG